MIAISCLHLISRPALVSSTLRVRAAGSATAGGTQQFIIIALKRIDFHYKAHHETQKLHAFVF